MRRNHLLLAGAFFLAVIALWASASWADVPTVAIRGPGEVRGDQLLSITIDIRHKGNNFIHHLSKLVIYVNGREEKTWEYSWRNYPKEENWSLSHQLTLTQNGTVSAIATCNLHGPSQEASLLVTVGSSR